MTSIGATTYAFTVVYTDELALDTATINTTDVTVSGPAFGVNAPVNGYNIDNKTTTSATVTYTINIPGGWQGTHNGSYTINMVGNEVGDLEAPVNYVQPDKIGTFNVGIAIIKEVSTLVDEQDLDYSDGDLSLREAIFLVNSSSRPTT